MSVVPTFDGRQEQRTLFQAASRFGDEMEFHFIDGTIETGSVRCHDEDGFFGLHGNPWRFNIAHVIKWKKAGE